MSYSTAVPLSERKLIERIRRMASRPRAAALHLMRGIGDDCAVLRPPLGHDLLVTTDFSIEGTHFRREWHPADSVGHRCLARGLSDIAAMGGEPLAAFLSLALPDDVSQRWADAFLRGLLRLAREHRVPLAGGDVSSTSGPIAADIVVIGAVPRGRALLRSGARAGDAIYVTGALGGSAAALKRMLNGEKLRRRAFPAHFFPEPRLAAGRALRERRLATACIDLSDGLSTDLSHIWEESGVGAVVYAESVPVAKGSTLELALHGGEDYELLFTSRARVPREIAGVKVTRIGEIVQTRGRPSLRSGQAKCHMWLAEASGRQSALRPQGWEHFRK